MTTDYDFWLFDLDGTLVDIEPAYPRKVMGSVGDRLGVEFTDRERDALWYGFGGTRSQTLAERDVDQQEFWRLFHEEEDPVARAEATYLYDDAEAFLATLDTPVGLVTHCQQYLTEPVLAHLDIADWFETVVCCDDDIGWKPDPKPVELAMREMDVWYNGHSGVLAGDNPSDIGAAWNAGLDGVHVGRRSPAEMGRCVRGDRRVASLLDLASSQGR
ncbi:HAD family hydrolase [Haloarcula hispanica]|uniref:HAD family hydrolase n=1 Tax=Haloarcula hispanica TaxID=51589 RepID=A0A482T3Y2_HALHI|nr:HAD family hydrolase [Haloarcula hispanica]MCJ0619570.1 HAD family hydrolase [Haloarcula hispanica]RYJ10046.1 HAD family hydrolase [Haloarcula hispanica]